MFIDNPFRPHNVIVNLLVTAERIESIANEDAFTSLSLPIGNFTNLIFISQFLPRNAMHVYVRPLSVCPSLSGIVSKRLNLSSKFCYHLTAPTLQFTMNQIAFRNSSGITPNGGHKYRRGIKNSRFLTNKPLYHGNGAMSYSKTARFGFRLP